MTLTFEHRPSYGHARYYPVDPVARALCRLAGRTSINESEIIALAEAGFRVELIDAATAVRRVV